MEILLIDEEEGLRASERKMWEDGDWSSAIISFLSRHCFLHLLRIRDAARSRTLGARLLVAAFFYPAYLVAMVVWGTAATILTILFPVLFFVGHTAKNRTP